MAGRRERVGNNGFGQPQQNPFFGQPPQNPPQNPFFGQPPQNPPQNPFFGQPPQNPARLFRQMINDERQEDYGVPMVIADEDEQIEQRQQVEERERERQRQQVEEEQRQRQQVEEQRQRRREYEERRRQVEEQERERERQVEERMAEIRREVEEGEQQRRRDYEERRRQVEERERERQQVEEQRQRQQVEEQRQRQQVEEREQLSEQERAFLEDRDQYGNDLDFLTDLLNSIAGGNTILNTIDYFNFMRIGESSYVDEIEAANRLLLLDRQRRMGYMSYFTPRHLSQLIAYTPRDIAQLIVYIADNNVRNQIINELQNIQQLQQRRREMFHNVEQQELLRIRDLRRQRRQNRQDRQPQQQNDQQQPQQQNDQQQPQQQNDQQQPQQQNDQQQPQQNYPDKNSVVLGTNHTYNDLAVHLFVIYDDYTGCMGIHQAFAEMQNPIAALNIMTESLNSRPLDVVIPDYDTVPNEQQQAFLTDLILGSFTTYLGRSDYQYPAGQLDRIIGALTVRYNDNFYRLGRRGGTPINHYYYYIVIFLFMQFQPEQFQTDWALTLMTEDSDAYNDAQRGSCDGGITERLLTVMGQVLFTNIGPDLPEIIIQKQQRRQKKIMLKRWFEEWYQYYYANNDTNYNTEEGRARINESIRQYINDKIAEGGDLGITNDDINSLLESNEDMLMTMTGGKRKLKTKQSKRTKNATCEKKKKTKKKQKKQNTRKKKTKQTKKTKRANV